jgi:hypothetical protein
MATNKYFHWRFSQWVLEKSQMMMIIMAEDDLVEGCRLVGGCRLLGPVGLGGRVLRLALVGHFSLRGHDSQYSEFVFCTLKTLTTESKRQLFNFNVSNYRQDSLPPNYFIIRIFYYYYYFVNWLCPWYPPYALTL